MPHFLRRSSSLSCASYSICMCMCVLVMQHSFLFHIIWQNVKSVCFLHRPTPARSAFILHSIFLISFFIRLDLSWAFDYHMYVCNGQYHTGTVQLSIYNFIIVRNSFSFSLFNSLSFVHSLALFHLIYPFIFWRFIRMICVLHFIHSWLNIKDNYLKKKNYNKRHAFTKYIILRKIKYGQTSRIN